MNGFRTNFCVRVSDARNDGFKELKNPLVPKKSFL